MQYLLFLFLLVASTLALPSFAQTNVKPVQPFVWGVAGHPRWEYGDIPPATIINLVKELGCNYYRVDAWRDEEIDPLIPLAAQQKITLLPIIYKPLNIFNTDVSEQEIYQQSYNRGLAFATKYKGQFPYIELDNELDIPSMKPGRDGAQKSHYDDAKYRRCMNALKGLGNGVKAGDPNARRLIGTAGWYHYGFVDRLIEDGVPFEVLAWHWYSEMGSMSRVMHKLHSYGKPIWITEMNRRNGSLAKNGAPELDEAANAEILSGMINEMWGFPLVEAIFPYQLLDQPGKNPTDGEAHYGLLTLVREAATKKFQLGRKKPAFDAYQERITALGAQPSSGDIIVDDAYLKPAVSFTGEWTSATDAANHFKTYKHDNNANKGTLTARFRPVIPQTGRYTVSLWFPASPENSAATPVKIAHANGISEIKINQQNGGKWIVLGAFNFNAAEPGDAAYVQISNAGTAGRVVADAVKFQRE